MEVDSDLPSLGQIKQIHLVPALLLMTTNFNIEQKSEVMQ